MFFGTITFSLQYLNHPTMPLNSIFSFKINFMKIKTLVLFTMVSFFLGAQTVGNIPKYATGTTFNNSAIFQNGTNIGIGTTTPTGRLMINNQPSAVAAPGLYISYTPFAPGNSGSANDYLKIQQESYTIFNSTQPANTYLIVKSLTGYVGIGTASPTAVVDIKNITGTDPIIRLTSSIGNVTLQVNDNGNVGIGNNNPLEKLDVIGNLSLIITPYICVVIGIITMVCGGVVLQLLLRQLQVWMDQYCLVGVVGY